MRLHCRTSTSLMSYLLDMLQASCRICSQQPSFGNVGLSAAAAVGQWELTGSWRCRNPSSSVGLAASKRRRATSCLVTCVQLSSEAWHADLSEQSGLARHTPVGAVSPRAA